MKTPKEFDYDLWTTEENGVKKYFARVKSTGEVTEVSHECMKALRSFEKELRREIEEQEQVGTILSLDALIEDESCNCFLADHHDFIDEIIADETERTLLEAISEKQKIFYLNCMRKGKGLREYERETGIPYSTLRSMRESIKRKFKKICI